MEENLNFYLSLDPRHAASLEDEMAISHAVMGRLSTTTERMNRSLPADTLAGTGPRVGDTTLSDGMNERFSEMERMYREKLMELQGRKTSKMRF